MKICSLRNLNFDGIKIEFGELKKFKKSLRGDYTLIIRKIAWRIMKDGLIVCSSGEMFKLDKTKNEFVEMNEIDYLKFLPKNPNIETFDKISDFDYVAKVNNGYSLEFFSLANYDRKNFQLVDRQGNRIEDISFVAT